MSQTLSKLQNQALAEVLDNPIISKRVGGELKKFAGLMTLSVAMLAASGAAEARSHTGNKISAVLGGTSALMYLGGNTDGAKIMGGATAGSYIGSNLSRGSGGGAVVGAALGGLLVNGSIQQRKQQEMARAQGMYNNGYNNGYNNNNNNTIRQPSAMALYMVRGPQGFFVSVDNSPSVQQMQQGQFNGLPLGQNPQLAQDLEQKFHRFAQTYQNLEQVNGNFENASAARQNNYYQANYSYNPGYNGGYNNNQGYNRAQELQYNSQNLNQAAENYSKARGEFFLAADNAAFEGYSVANYREALNIIKPSPRVNVSLRGNNKYPIVDQNRAGFIIR